MRLPGSDSKFDAAKAPLSNEALLSFDSMEGVYESPVVIRQGSPTAVAMTRPVAERWMIPLIAAAAYAIHNLPIAPFQIASANGFRRPLSAATLAILLGIAARGAGWVTTAVLNDCRQLVKRLMPALIVLTGAGLNLTQVGAIGGAAMLITVACIVVAFGASLLFGRLLGAAFRTDRGSPRQIVEFVATGNADTFQAEFGLCH